MPRRSRPAPSAKHSRAHVRAQRDRHIARNWQAAKARYDRPGANPHPDACRADPGLPGAWWPFTLPAGRLARNPFNLCSCWMCSVSAATRRLGRRRERALWQADVQRELHDRDAAERPSRTARHAGGHQRARPDW